MASVPVPFFGAWHRSLFLVIASPFFFGRSNLSFFIGGRRYRHPGAKDEIASSQKALLAMTKWAISGSGRLHGPHNFVIASGAKQSQTY